MNSFGLNSAALNSSVGRVVLGAALLAASVTFAATPTRTTYADSAVATSNTQLRATGVRIALGAAQASSYLEAGADGIIAITATATSRATSGLTAFYTEAYAHSTFSASAAGTIVRPGAATSVSEFDLSATGERIGGFRASIELQSQFIADPSVTRSGSPHTERDGYAEPVSIVAGFTATGDRLALAEAMAEGSSTFSTTGATHIQAGAATMASTLAITAIPATDGCYCEITFTFTAKPTLTQYASVDLPSASALDASASVITTAAVDPAAGTSDFTADGRLALLGEAVSQSESEMAAIGRLAEQGAAIFIGEASIDAAPWIYRPAGAESLIESGFSAFGVRIYNGAATASSTLRFSALAIVNPTVPAPPTRTMRVPAQDRGMRVPAQNRTMKVPA